MVALLQLVNVIEGSVSMYLQTIILFDGVVLPSVLFVAEFSMQERIFCCLSRCAFLCMDTVNTPMSSSFHNQLFFCFIMKQTTGIVHPEQN